MLNKKLVFVEKIKITHYFFVMFSNMFPNPLNTSYQWWVRIDSPRNFEDAIDKSILKWYITAKEPRRGD